METALGPRLLRVNAVTSGAGLLIALLFSLLMRHSNSGANASGIRAMFLAAAFSVSSALISLMFLKTRIDPSE